MIGFERGVGEGGGGRSATGRSTAGGICSSVILDDAKAALFVVGSKVRIVPSSCLLLASTRTEPVWSSLFVQKSLFRRVCSEEFVQKSLFKAQNAVMCTNCHVPLLPCGFHSV